MVQMCKVMKYQVKSRHEMVFDYMSHGETFYMLLKGNVSCKVPFKQ